MLQLSVLLTQVGIFLYFQLVALFQPVVHCGSLGALLLIVHHIASMADTLILYILVFYCLCKQWYVMARGSK